MSAAVGAGTSGGVQSVAERPVAVEAVPADRAYLGIETRVVRFTLNPTANESDACPVTRVEVDLRNRFGDDSRLNVVTQVDGRAEWTTLAPGEARTVRFPGARCGQSVVVEATTPDGGVLIETTHTVPCPVQRVPGE